MKPILFNAEMVCAILNGQKTATRRIIKPQPKHVHTILGPSDEEDWTFDFLCGCIENGVCLDWIEMVKMPYQPGDILYVRETWSPLYQDKDSKDVRGYMYKACTLEEYDKMYPDGKDYQWEGKWRPSIHMPKEAARIFLRAINIRAERLQDITYEGCKAEGFDGVIFEDDTEGLPAIAINRFSRLWDSTIKKKDIELFGWEANPWVWAIEFERISREEAGGMKG